jgi:hypothetical protein
MPPASAMARITRNRLTNHAIPSPSAAHCTHQWPGEVMRLITNNIARISGAMNRNFTARKVFVVGQPPLGVILRKPGVKVSEE